MTLIQCRKLTREYRKGDNLIRPLDELDLDVPAHDFLALMGPSGSGKTTLLNLIAGIDSPSSGSLVIDGTDLAALSRNKLAAWRARNVGYVFQLYNLVPVLTAYENVELPLLLHSLSKTQRHERIVGALEQVGITDRADHFPRQLSGGQEQRVAIARAIVTDPAIIVADEPTGDLDKSAAHAVMTLLQKLNGELGKTIIMVTHDPHTTEYAKRTLHLDKGRLAENATESADSASDAPASDDASPQDPTGTSHAAASNAPNASNASNASAASAAAPPTASTDRQEAIA